MSELIPFEFEYQPHGKPKIFATAHIRLEGWYAQWSVERFETDEATTPADRSLMEAHLREWKASAITEKFKRALGK